MEPEDYEQMGAHSQIAGQTQKNAADAAQYYLEEKEKGLVEIQLEVDSILSDIYHLLRQDRLNFESDDPSSTWKESNKRERTLTDWGVERIMQLIKFYINKNTLLTNFDDKQIKRLMKTFLDELNDLVLLKYQNLFRIPTFEECREMIKEKLQDKIKMKMFAAEILHKEVSETEIEGELMMELEKTLEKEMSKIREEKRKEKIRDYGLLIAQLEVIVYSTLNRAWRGEERGSIRRHTQISELIGGRVPQGTPKQGGFFSWGGK